MNAAVFFALASLAAAPPITALAIAPGAEQVVVGSQAGIEVRGLSDLKAVRTLATELESIHALTFSPDGQTLAAGGGSPGERGVVELFAWPAGDRRAALPAGDDVVYCLAWHARGKQLAAACADQAIRLLPATGTETQVYRSHSAPVLATLWLDGRTLLTASVDQAIRVIAADSGQTLRSLDNHTGAVRGLALRPGMIDGSPILASAGADRTVRFWHPSTGRLVRFTKLPSAPTAIDWTPSGSHALVACEDGHLRSVDPQSLVVTAFAQGLAGWAHAVAALPDGSAALLAGEGGELRIVPLDAIKP